MRKIRSSIFGLILSLALIVSSYSQERIGGSVRISGSERISTSSSLNTSLISYWKLDEASGTRSDSKDSDDLTDNNTVGQTTCIITNAASFASASLRYLSIGSNSSVQAGDINWSWAFWVSLSSKAAFPRIISKNDGTNAEYEIFYRSDTDRFAVRVTKTGPTLVDQPATTLGSPALSTCYFIVVWHDATAQTINISVNNGAADSTSLAASLIAAGTGALNFGRRAGNADQYLSGSIDEAGYWKKVLSASERTTLWNGGVGKTCCPY